MAGPGKPPGSDWEEEAEIFVETPTVRSEIRPLPEAPGYEDAGADVAVDEFENDRDTQPGAPQVGDASMIAEPLPEMSAEMWQAGIQAVVSVPDEAAPMWPTAEEWTAEARRYRTESTLAESPEEAARLLLAAARALEHAGDVASAARLCDEALSHDPNATDVLRARARLAEGAGELDDAHALWAHLATAATSADERAFYGALSAEWTLARGGRLPPIARQALAAGPARALAQAEEALRAGAPAEVAAALADAGRGTGAALGAALFDHAGRCREAARDRPGAVAARLEAAKLDPYATPSLAGRLRDAARADDKTALALLDELARPAAFLGIERADAHNLRARIVQATQPAIAIDDYRQSLERYREVERALDSASLTEFHNRFDDFLVNLASLRQQVPADDAVRKLLTDALTFYVARGRTAVSAGSRSEAQTVVDNLTRLVPQLPDNDRRSSEGVLKEL
ncbi:MAG TPA: tetratricopeptide repeat protein, partial [Polyangia bacterium]